MGLNFKVMSIGIIVMFFTAMMPFSALIILSILGGEVLVLGIQEIFFYLGWLINPIIMIIAGIVVVRIADAPELSRGLLAGVILALTYTIVLLGMQVAFTPEGPLVLPFSGIELTGAYMLPFSDMIIKAYVFCILGGLLGAYSVQKSAPEAIKF